MQIIQHPSYTHRQAATYLYGAVALFAVVFAITLLLRNTKSPTLRLLDLLVLMFGISGITVRFLPGLMSWFVGAVGEKRTLGRLRALPGGYTAVANFVAPGGRRGDVDLVLIGPMGVLACEIKTYEGVMVYEGGRWWKRRPNGWKTPIKGNPSAQAKRNGDAVRGFIGEHKRIAPRLDGAAVPVMPIVIFVGADGLETGSLKITALRAPDLLTHVMSLPRTLTDEQAAAVAGLFAVGAGKAAAVD